MPLSIKALALTGAGYAGPNGFAGVIVVTVYALLDGTIAGALIAWLYNLTGGQQQRPATQTPPRM
jgi:hypothetical protein